MLLVSKKFNQQKLKFVTFQSDAWSEDGVYDSDNENEEMVCVNMEWWLTC